MGEVDWADPEVERATWDGFYDDREAVWSGDPNHALVVEASALAPSTALDVGCGEGADAVWLAARGWRVTAIDVSEVALGRARVAAAAAGVDVDWVRSGVAGVDPARRRFDLVTAFFPALPRAAGTAYVGRLLDLVAPGGTLLTVFHAPPPDGAHDPHHPDHDAEDGDGEEGQRPRFDPDDFIGPEEVLAALGAGWELEAHEERPRSIAGGAGAHHTHDLVIRARRTP